MADSVRMTDLSPLSRGLEGFRRLDPEQRILTDRTGTQAAAEHLIEVRRDVPHAEEAPEAHDRNRPEHRKNRRRRQTRNDPHPADTALEAAPESSEGHLLDIHA